MTLTVTRDRTPCGTGSPSGAAVITLVCAFLSLTGDARATGGGHDALSGASRASTANAGARQDALVCEGAHVGGNRPLSLAAYAVDIELTDEGAGPLAEPPLVSPRSPGQIRKSILDEAGRRMEGCFDWAQGRWPQLAGDVHLNLTIDPWGIVADVAMAPTPASPLRELARCAADVLRFVQVGGWTPRTTVADLNLHFWKTPPRKAQRQRRPTPSIPVKSVEPSCVARTNLPLEHLDCGQIDVPAVPSLHEPRRQLIDVIPSHTASDPSHLPSDVVDAVRSNLGAYQTCYAEARAHKWAPASAGERVWLRGTLDATGHFSKVLLAAEHGRESDLETCLERALSQVWIVQTWPPKLSTVDVYFSLGPAKLATAADGGHLVIDRARAGIDAASSVKAGPADPRTCRLHLGQIEAAMKAVPWGEGAAVRVAIDELAGWLGRYADSSTTDCIEQAGSLLRRHAMMAFEGGLRLHSEALLALAETRLRRLLALRPALPNGRQLRLDLARTLFQLGKWNEAEAMCASLGSATTLDSIAAEASKLTVQSLEALTGVAEVVPQPAAVGQLALGPAESRLLAAYERLCLPDGGLGTCSDRQAFRHALLLHREGQFERAARQARILALNPGDSFVQVQAADLVLLALKAQRRTTELCAFASEVARAPVAEEVWNGRLWRSVRRTCAVP